MTINDIEKEELLENKSNFINARFIKAKALKRVKELIKNDFKEDEVEDVTNVYLDIQIPTPGHPKKYYYLFANKNDALIYASLYNFSLIDKEKVIDEDTFAEWTEIFERYLRVFQDASELKKYMSENNLVLSGGFRYKLRGGN